jgi:hypothetical protein
MIYDLFYLFENKEINKDEIKFCEVDSQKTFDPEKQCHDCFEQFQETFYCLMMMHEEKLLFKINCGCKMGQRFHNNYKYFGHLGYDRSERSLHNFDDYEVIKLRDEHYGDSDEEDYENGNSYFLK